MPLRLASQLLMLSTTSMSFALFSALCFALFSSFPVSSSLPSLSALLFAPPLSIFLSVAVGFLAVYIAMLESLAPLVPVLPVSWVEGVCVNCRQPVCSVKPVCLR